ncbi:MAG: NYN domain-containing protein, partial [Longimicrobiales bacterium]
MSNPYSQAPYTGLPDASAHRAPNAALLIDFDNVTMGMRSDLSKELKTLLQSDMIKGKVTVQRAYADWRRYPQYIVSLSEASVDLIFAPAYGSSKKNATDIRMAIDALELVFIRPEIGTYILLTGDSDFSSLVLKLKEYGKYVIGVGIQESSSDILVQNCDEYYSYTSITGLRKTTESSDKPSDPWELVESALSRMTKRGDVMRSDRLKQVMMELDGNFDEGSFGFSKFSRFMTEASSRGLVKLQKLPNGQYEVTPGRAGGSIDTATRDKPERRPRGGRGRGRTVQAAAPDPAAPDPKDSDPTPPEIPSDSDPLRAAYDLLEQALVALKNIGRETVRDSDVKRKMLQLSPSFDESDLGFSKFSRFLRQAGDHGIVHLHQMSTGNVQVSLTPTPAPDDEKGQEAQSEATLEPAAPTPEAPTPEAPPEGDEPRQGTLSGWLGRLGVRTGSRARRSTTGPVLLDGQTVGGGEAIKTDTSPPGGAGTDGLDAAALGLPTGSRAMVQ